MHDNSAVQPNRHRMQRRGNVREQAPDRRQAEMIVPPADRGDGNQAEQDCSGNVGRARVNSE